MARIFVVTPARPGSASGNAHTAGRIAAHLEALGHDASVATHYDGANADALVAVHAYRSASAVQAFRARYPDRPVVLVLAGTDVNAFIDTHPRETLAAMRSADALVGLHEQVGARLPRDLLGRLRIIFQSALATNRSQHPAPPPLRLSVVSYLRDVKDPLRTAYAVRDLPPASSITVHHAGGAHDDTWAALARTEHASNPRYTWLGEQTPGEVANLYAASHALVVSSHAEGGANVVSEALRAGLVVVASRIDGNLGLLGEDYPATYPAGDTAALRTLLLALENDADLWQGVASRCAALAPRFAPALERAAWAKLLASLGVPGSASE